MIVRVRNLSDVANLLCSHQHATKLDCSFATEDADLDSVAAVLEHNNSVTEIDLSGLKCSAIALKGIFSLPHLERLNLSGTF